MKALLNSFFDLIKRINAYTENSITYWSVLAIFQIPLILFGILIRDWILAGAMTILLILSLSYIRKIKKRKQNDKTNTTP